MVFMACGAYGVLRPYSAPWMYGDKTGAEELACGAEGERGKQRGVGGGNVTCEGAYEHVTRRNKDMDIAMFICRLSLLCFAHFMFYLLDYKFLQLEYNLRILMPA